MMRWRSSPQQATEASSPPPPPSAEAALTGESSSSSSSGVGGGDRDHHHHHHHHHQEDDHDDAGNDNDGGGPASGGGGQTSSSSSPPSSSSSMALEWSSSRGSGNRGGVGGMAGGIIMDGDGDGDDGDGDGGRDHHYRHYHHGDDDGDSADNAGASSSSSRAGAAASSSSSTNNGGGGGGQPTLFQFSGAPSSAVGGLGGVGGGMTPSAPLPTMNLPAFPSSAPQNTHVGGITNLPPFPTAAVGAASGSGGALSLGVGVVGGGANSMRGGGADPNLLLASGGSKNKKLKYNSTRQSGGGGAAAAAVVPLYNTHHIHHNGDSSSSQSMLLPQPFAASVPLSSSATSHHNSINHASNPNTNNNNNSTLSTSSSSSLAAPIFQFTSNTKGSTTTNSTTSTTASLDNGHSASHCVGGGSSSNGNSTTGSSSSIIHNNAPVVGSSLMSGGSGTTTTTTTTTTTSALSFGFGAPPPPMAGSTNTVGGGAVIPFLGVPPSNNNAALGRAVNAVGNGNGGSNGSGGGGGPIHPSSDSDSGMGNHHNSGGGGGGSSSSGASSSVLPSANHGSMNNNNNNNTNSNSGDATAAMNNNNSNTSSTSSNQPPPTWTPQTHTSTCEFTYTITDYAQKRDSGCKKAEYSNTTVDPHGNKWRLIIYVNGNGRASNHHLSLFLQVADAEELPFGWNKAVSYVLTLEHPHGPSLGYAKRNPDKTFKLCPKAIDWGWSQFITSDRIQQEGYVHNNSLTVRASVTVKSSSVTIDPEDAELYLKCAVEEGNPDAVRSCLAQDARVNCQFKDDLYTPLHTACSANGEAGNNNGNGGGGSNGSSSSSSSNNNNNNGGAPGPISPGSLEVLHLLLERGADVNACNKWRETPLLIAANNGHVEAVKGLLDAGADPSLCSEAGWSALTFAAHKGYEEIVGLLLAAGAPVNCRVTEDLSTPLHKACAGGKPGHLSAVQQLLEGDADVHALNKWRETPLLTAANHGQSAAVEALLNHGADPCKCTDTGWSPLSIAAYKGHDEVVRLLLEEGAPTEEADPTLSALLQAATKGLPDTVMLLLRHGADHTVTTKKGDTALAILVEQNLIDAAVEMVTDYNASVPRCSRDRKKVQRARLLINLRLKQMHREGHPRGMSDDDSDHDESDSEEENETVALHTAGDSAASPLTSAGSKKKKNKNAGTTSIAKAEADARAAEEALLLEIEAEEQERIAASESKNNKKKKKKKERDRQQKAEKAKDEVKEQDSKVKDANPPSKPALSPAKKEKVVELSAQTISVKKTKEVFVDSLPKPKKDNPSIRVKEVSLPSQPAQHKKQSESKSNLKWAEGAETKQKGAVEKAETKVKKVREVSLPKPEPAKKPAPPNTVNNLRSTKTPTKGQSNAPKKIPGDNPKVPVQQSRQNTQPTPQPKAASAPVLKKRGWESKAAPSTVAATPVPGESQPKTQPSKSTSTTTAKSAKESKTTTSAEAAASGANAKNRPSSATRLDDSLHSTAASLPPTPNQTQMQPTMDPKVSVDDQLASMANDVLGFLDFDSQPPPQPSSYQDFSAGTSGANEGFQGLPGYPSAPRRTSITPPPSNLQGGGTIPSAVGKSPSINSPGASSANIPSFMSSISVEFPAVSLFRLEKLQELFRKCAEARSSPNHPFRVIDEHTLRAVLYRWIIRASHGSESFLDPVIPSWDDVDYLRAFLQRQFISENRRSVEETRYSANVPTSIEVLRDAGAAMSELCISLAKEVVQFQSQCEQQVPANWSDLDINVSAMQENDNVLIDWSGRSRVSIPFIVFSSMSKRYVGEQNRLMSSVFSAVRRHEIIGAIAEQTNLSCRLPPQTLDCLSKGLGANLETWTDSISVYGNNFFCAMFPDVDAAFGGLLPFGKENGGGEAILNRAGGSAIIVTPPESATSSQYIRTMIDMVEGSSNIPLSFSVVLCSDCFVNANATLSVDDLMSLDPRLCGEQNGFISYIETFPAGSSTFSNLSSMFILMQNEAGKMNFPPHPSVLDNIRRTMRSDMGIRNDVPMVANFSGMANDSRYDAAPSFQSMPQPQYASASQEMQFSSSPFAIGGGVNRGRGHRGRLFELVGGDEAEEEQGMNIPGLDNLDMSMFSNNTQGDVDIEAISLMGIGGHALNGTMNNHNNS